MKQYGLIGKPLGHSFSQKYFTEKFQTENIDARYDLYPLNNIEEVTELINNTPNLVGFNVTIPYKQQILPYLNALDDEAANVGAVNVVEISRTNSGIYLKGYNSDIYGFYNSIKPLLKPWHTNALILGTGGASKAVSAMLRKLNIEFTFVSRTAKDGQLTYNDLTPEVMNEHKVIVNCSPLGTYPNTDTCPDIPYQLITPQHLAYDLVYNPKLTLFLSKAQQQGATIKNGLEMLHLQAEAAWKYWNE
mgnify:CR=1 FL=1